jgi:hypothetical protein
MTQQQLREPMTSAHQIATRVLTRTHQITRRLLLQRRDPHRGDLAEPKQPRQPLSITPVGLDAISRSPHPRRRRDNAVDPCFRTRTRKAIAGRPASETTRTGAGNVRNHPTVSPAGGSRSERTSPVP